MKNIRTAALRFLIVYQCSVAEERNVVLQLIKFMIVFIRLAQLKEQKFIISVIFTLCSYKSFCRKEIWSLAQHAYYFFFSVKEHFTFRYGQCSYLVIFFSLRLIAHSYRIYHKLSTKETLNFMEFISPRLTHRQIMLINSTLS